LYKGGRSLIFFLAMFGMVCWGIAPVFGKIGLTSINPITGLVIRTYLSAALLTGWLIFSGDWVQLKTVPLKAVFFIGIEGILATLVGDLAYYAAIKYGEISFVTLVMACSPIISIMIAVLFLKEKVTISSLLGTAMIIGGLTLVIRH